MSLMNLLREAQGGQGLGQLAERLGMDRAEAEGLAGMLAPTIGRAATKRADNGDAERVLGQFRGEAQGDWFENPAAAAEPEAREQGEQFLESLLGSREATRELAHEAAGRTNVAPSKVEAFLPALAAMLQGGMQKRTPDSELDGILGSLGMASPGTHTGQSGGGLMGAITGALGGMLGGGGRSAGQPQGGSPLGGLAQMLDADGDGSPLDDILERVMRR